MGNPDIAAFINSQIGRLYLTVEPGFLGTVEILYRASDGMLFSDAARVSITVADSTEDRGLGLDDIDPQDYAGFGITYFNGELYGIPGDAAVSPQAVDLSDNFPLPGDQGTQGSCVGWATSYALKSYQERLDFGWSLNTTDHLFSPAYVYNQIKVAGCSSGSQISDALQLLVDQGAATLTSMPYTAQECSTQPTTNIRQEASNYRATRYARINDTLGIKAALANRLPVVIGLDIYQQLFDLSGPNAVYNTATGARFGGHAVTIIGYDDNRYGGAFRVINSWGQNWGDNGYFWLPYNFYSGIVRQAWVLEDLDNTSPPPPSVPTEPVPSGDLPNLQVDSWYATYDPRPQGQGSLEWNVINTGPGIALKGANVNFMLSTDSNFNSNDIYVVYEDIPFDMEPGTSVFRDTTNQINFSFPDNLQPGVYYMALWIDDLQEVAESNENDNISVSSTLVSISNTKPDLVVWTWYANWDGFGNGTLTYDVRNHGNGTADISDWDINLVLSPDQLIGNQNEIFLFYEDATFQLGPGGRVFRDSFNPAFFNLATDQLGLAVPPGDYFMALWVDNLNQVDESNELNNSSLGGSMVTISQSGALRAKPYSALANESEELQAQLDGTEKNSAYNGKVLGKPDQLVRKVRIIDRPDGGRELKILDEDPKPFSATEQSNQYTKASGSRNTVIFPITERLAMPSGSTGP